MRGTVSGRSRTLTVGVCLLLFAAVGGIAYAAEASPFVGPHGNINCCLPPNGGVPHIWKPGHRCSGGYVGLAFPSSGVTGPSGATGVTGPTGATNPSAATVNGQSATKVTGRLLTPSSTTATLVLYDNDGLTITADCATNGDASLVATGPGSADSELMVGGYDSGGSYGSQTNALAPASDAALGPAGSGEASFSYESSAGQIVSGEIGYQAAHSFATYTGCAYFGEVTSG